MALINCSNCGKPISDKAVKCPHCGEFVHSENLSVKPFGFHKTWLLVIIGVAALWGVYCLDVLNLHILNDDYATDKARDYYTYTMTAFIIAIGIATLLVTINLWRTPIKVCFCLTLAASAVLIAIAGYDRFNPSDSSGRGQCGLASYYMDKGDYQSALKWYERASECGNAAAYNSLGFIYAKGEAVEKNNEKAIQFFQQAIKIAEAENWTAIIIQANKYLGQVYLEQNNMQEAVVQFYQALQTAESESYDYEANEIKELLQKIEAEKQAEKQATLEEFENFQTKDLSAFMLHGKVKSVEESNGGQVACTYYFSEQGELTKAVMSEGNYRCKIKRKTNKLVLSFENPNDEYGGWGYVYTVDNSGRLISSQYGSEDFGDEATYSNFNSNGWPTRSKGIAELGGAVTISTLSYSQIDEHGNWTQQLLKDDEGNEVTTYRSIEYYK